MRALILAAALFAALAPFSPAEAQEMVFVMRHAEKEFTGADPHLSDAGRKRAHDWAAFLSNADIDIVINTDATRSRETGEIIAMSLDADRAEVPMADVTGLVDLLDFDHAADRVLVVAHTETIPAILQRLGAPEIAPIAADDYANMYVVVAADGPAASFVHLRMP